MSAASAELQHLFPTTILIAEHRDAESLDRTLLEHVEAVRASDPEGRRRSNNLAWQSDRLDRSHDAVRAFTEFVLANATQYGRACGWRFKDSMRLVMPELWVNVNGPHGFNRIHVHPNALVSGVYYLRVPEDAGQLILHDPRKQAQVLMPELAERNFRNVHQHNVEPRAGRLVLFPSWLEHGVSPNLSSGERVSLSFNVDLVPVELVGR